MRYSIEIQQQGWNEEVEGEGRRERREEDGDSQKDRGRGNAAVARKPTSNMSVKGEGVSL